MWYGKYDNWDPPSVSDYASENENLRSQVQRLNSVVDSLRDELWNLQHPQAQAVLDEILNSWDRKKDFEDM
jgi:hypothetical protein